MIATLTHCAHSIPLHDYTPGAYRVLLLAAFMAESDGSGRAVVEIDRQWFARRIGCSVSTVGAGVRELLARGALLTVSPAVTNVVRDKRTSTVYAVLPLLEPWD